MPTVADRVAQTVVAGHLSERVEQIFHPDSFGYRPGKSALDAVASCRERCWQFDWVVEFDIRKFFDTLLLQQILADPDWAERLTDADRRALSPLFWTHINPYGRFELDMNHRLDFTAALTVPRPRTSPEAETPEPATDGAAGVAS
ncbi:reverse transcriptase domain-containing protein [Streptomyces sp. NPDC004232]|uniref:reverse transcriptase domain-containing protein n=1 Tax=Streptomyces sp. NPDC004232 TaxID=3154454 RepID=UPI0033BD74C5